MLSTLNNKKDCGTNTFCIKVGDHQRVLELAAHCVPHGLSIRVAVFSLVQVIPDSMCYRLSKEGLPEHDMWKLWHAIKYGTPFKGVLPEGRLVHYKVHEHGRLVEKGRYMYTAKDGLVADYVTAIGENGDWHVTAAGAHRDLQLLVRGDDGVYNQVKTFLGSGRECIEAQLTVKWNGIDDDLCVDGLFA